MRILHTEASPGWGGQEIRILEEAKGMRKRGHEVVFALQKGMSLSQHARKEGFIVYEISFKKSHAGLVLVHLVSIIKKQRIDIVNTHSSLDAWIGGIASRLMRRPIIRTRHLSTPIKKGLNSKLLYNLLADIVVTTCEETAYVLRKQAFLSPQRCLSIPTGINPEKIVTDPNHIKEFRDKLGLKEGDLLAGTLCVIRGWKGISDLLHAAKLLKHIPQLKWVIIGGGVSEEHFRNECRSLQLENKVHFTGFLSPPFNALASLDMFLLLSYAHEGVSQASLQAAFLKKPLITTKTGGLKEVCLHDKTGVQVNVNAPQEIADAVCKLMASSKLREDLGHQAHLLVKEKFTMDTTLNEMEKIYTSFKI